MGIGDAACGAGESVLAVGDRRGHPRPLDVAIGIVAVVVKVAVLAGAEVFIAKLRLIRVPELLAGSFLLALLAVTAANFFTAGA
jgi:formate hydrogenlyase subunit 4